MPAYLSPYHPYQPEPDIAPFDLQSIPADDDDTPLAIEKPISSVSTGQSSSHRHVVFPPLILGCSTFGYGIYTDLDNVKSAMPLRIIRLAMRYGINAFDTSSWYHPSEIILGNALRALGYHREQYHLITKVGKYGPGSRDHTWEPDIIRACVKRSLERLGTDYLDVVYLHDVEYTLPPPSYSGNPLSDLSTILSQPLTPTPEESAILRGISTLRELQSANKITLIGIAGYPLPILLRLALLTLHTSGIALDVVQTYGHRTLQNDALAQGYLQAFEDAAKVGRVTSASPLAMGMLTTHGGPDWHPAREIPKLYEATREASKLCEERGTTLQDVSLAFGYRPLYQSPGKRVPIVVGCTDLAQVRDTVRRWQQVNPANTGHGPVSKDDTLEDEVKALFQERGVQGWSWTCPTDSQRTG